MWTPGDIKIWNSDVQKRKSGRVEGLAGQSPQQTAWEGLDMGPAGGRAGVWTGDADRARGA